MTSTTHQRKYECMYCQGSSVELMDVLDSSSFSGPNRGHYITIVKSHGLWLLFDDDIVEVCPVDILNVTVKKSLANEVNIIM